MYQFFTLSETYIPYGHQNTQSLSIQSDKSGKSKWLHLEQQYVEFLIFKNDS